MDDTKRKKKRAKRPPPSIRPKRVPIRHTMVIERPSDEVGRPSKTKIEVTSEAPTPAWVRRMAAQNYVGDPEGRSIRWWYENDPMCQIVTMDTMNRWAAVDGWVERRRQFLDKLNRRAESRMANAVFRARLEDLKKREQLMRLAEQRLNPQSPEQALPSNSFEALLNAYTRLGTEVDEMREKLADVVTPGVLAATETAEESPSQRARVRPQLDEQEARAAAATILSLRRQKHRAALRAAEAAAEEEEPANLRVIKGEK